MRLSIRWVVSFLCVAAAAPLGAQGISLSLATDSTHIAIDSSHVSAPSTDRVTQVAAGAPLTGLRAGVHLRETGIPNHVTFAETRHLGQDKAMMVVGVAGLIVGAVIGGTPGTIIMVGGAVVGLIGLYDYVQ